MLQKRIALFLLALAVAGCSRTPSKEQVKASIRPLVPGNFDVVEVNPVPDLGGVFQVVLRTQQQPVVIYMDKNLKYLFAGSLIAIDKKVNLTLQALAKYGAQPGRH